jgi:4-hydroxy-tetrahydrodipicolinate synthase
MRKNNGLEGYIVALVTPFDQQKNVDLKAFEKYVDFVVSKGVHGIVVCGSTGESLALSDEEKLSLVKCASNIAKGRTNVIGGIIDSVTEHGVKLIREFEEYVDNFLCICPYYIKPSQTQLFNHFKAYCESTKKGIILYNNPGRTAIDLKSDTFKKLCDFDNVIAIKECASDLSRFVFWKDYLKHDFSFLTGNDDMAPSALAMGACGVVSVTANIAPALCEAMYKAWNDRDMEKFANIRDRLAVMHNLMFAEPSPAPAKYALAKMGLIQNVLREPLSPISEELAKTIDLNMEKLEIE